MLQPSEGVPAACPMERQTASPDGHSRITAVAADLGLGWTATR